MFDTVIHCEIITIIKLIAYQSPQLPFFVCVVRTLEIPLSKFQVYNTLLLTIVTMLHISSLELITEICTL